MIPSVENEVQSASSLECLSSKVLRLPRNLRRCPADARRRQGVHPTPWQAAKCCACHEICAGAQPTPDDARAYIRPLGKQQSAAPATKSAPVPTRRQTTPGRTSDPLASSKVLRLPRNLRRCPWRRQTTPGRTSDPLASSKVLRLPRNLRRCSADARRRQGVHPTHLKAFCCKVGVNFLKVGVGKRTQNVIGFMTCSNVMD